MNEALKELEGINDEILEIIDRLEELAEDNPQYSAKINRMIDELSRACDIVDEI